MMPGFISQDDATCQTQRYAKSGCRNRDSPAAERTDSGKGTEEATAQRGRFLAQSLQSPLTT